MATFEESALQSGKVLADTGKYRASVAFVPRCVAADTSDCGRAVGCERAVGTSPLFKAAIAPMVLSFWLVGYSVSADSLRD